MINVGSETIKLACKMLRTAVTMGMHLAESAA